jgi:hypothetical protein
MKARSIVMNKILMLAFSALLSLGLAGVMPSPAPGSPDDPPPPHKKKGEHDKKGEAAKKGEPGPAGDLRRAYDLLRRIKANDGPSGRSDERLRDWTDRAAKLYRRGIQAHATGDPRLAHEYGAAAHDLARAVDHARNASGFDRPDADLPPPPEGPGPQADGAQARRDLRHAYDRIRELDDDTGAEAKFYLDAARDLYNAARRDVQADRNERGGELAKAAEALTHVPEHLAHLAGPEPDGPRAKGGPPEPPDTKADRPGPKAKKGERPEAKPKKGERSDPKPKKGERPDDDDDLPPPLPPRE